MKVLYKKLNSIILISLLFITVFIISIELFIQFGPVEFANTEETFIEFTEISVHDLTENVVTNSADTSILTNSADTSIYLDKYLELTGIIRVKAVNGSYIRLGCEDPYCKACFAYGPRCYLLDDAAKSKINEYTVDDVITIQCLVTSVDNEFGYTCDVINIL